MDCGPKFVPKSLVMHQLGGARRSWTIPVIMLRSADWNAHIHDVPPPPEDPAPANGNPHPMYGPEITAEQLFQQQLAQWLQQNMQFGGNQGGNNHNVHHLQVHDPMPFHAQEDINMAQEDNNLALLQQMLQEAPLYNFQHILAEQGVHFSAGVHPSVHGLTDSPMQAWHDSISSSSSGGSEMSIDVLDAFHINSFTVDSFSHMHSEIWARITLVKAIINSVDQPSIQDNSKYLSISVDFPRQVLFEMVREFARLTQDREIASALALPEIPLMINSLSSVDNSMSMTSTSLDAHSTSSSSAPLSGKGRKRKQVMQAQAPECTTQVRRSPRGNKYNGFKPRNDSEKKPVASKVKPMKDPTILLKIDDDGPSNATPAETLVPTIQAIAVNLCGVPPDEVSPKKLLASLQEEDDSDNSA
jgi:hypothetical protein